jgi:hypothetical protein
MICFIWYLERCCITMEKGIDGRHLQLRRADKNLSIPIPIPTQKFTNWGCMAGLDQYPND